MTLSFIVAVGRNRVIGEKGRLPWHLPADLKRFKEITWGRPILMGRATYESIGKPLIGRRNVVVTRSPGFRALGCDIVESPEAALELLKDVEEVICIGGASLYEQLMARASRIYLTDVDADVPGDRFWPGVDEEAWEEVSREARPADDRNCYPLVFRVLQRKLPAGG